MSSPLQQGVQLRTTVQWWLSSGLPSASHVGGIDAQAAEAAARGASTAQQSLQRLLNCVKSINQVLQQRTALSAASKAINMHTPSDQTSSSSSSSWQGHRSSDSAGDDVQHCGLDQQQQRWRQQQPQPDWLLAGMRKAEWALEAVMVPVKTARAPYLQQRIDPLSVTASPCLLSLPASLVVAGEALCAAVPSSACCSNPRCTNLGGVSASYTGAGQGQRVWRVPGAAGWTGNSYVRSRRTGGSKVRTILIWAKRFLENQRPQPSHDFACHDGLARYDQCLT
jgi:hypothetical protein